MTCYQTSAQRESKKKENVKIKNHLQKANPFTLNTNLTLLVNGLAVFPVSPYPDPLAHLKPLLTIISKQHNRHLFFSLHIHISVLKPHVQIDPENTTL
jgi:DNA-binding sugar fermentation-stimulating protein